MNEQKKNILNKFTTHYKQTIVRAYHSSLVEKKATIELEDLFWSILEERGSLAYETLIKAGMRQTNLNIDANKFKRIDLEQILHSKKDVVLSESSKRVIASSVSLAGEHNHSYIGTEHLLYSILKNLDVVVAQILADNKINSEELLKNLEVVLNSTSKFSEMTGAVDSIKEHIKTAKENNSKDESILDVFSTELTNMNVQKEINPVIGREAEIERVIQILCRKTKNNPVLLGEPGVGKTAIVEGLAKKILEGDVPSVLINKKIYSLDMPMVVAGTTYRGEFEARIKQVIDDIKADPDAILFVDEIHNIVGAGSTPGSMDAANILKPALARGEIRCIGATTYDDWKKHIEPDNALVRRLQKVDVSEPTEAEAMEILKGIKGNFEKHHMVLIGNDAVEAAVKLSNRYITDQFLPDKAIDLIDEVASAKHIKMPRNKTVAEINHLEDELDNLIKEKNKLVRTEQYKEALRLKSQELDIVNKICDLEEHELKNKLKRQEEFSAEKVSAQDIRELVQKMTKIEIPDLNNIKSVNFKNVANSLKKNVIGQDEALDEVVNTLKRSMAGLSGNDRPLGSFIFAGPSGVGKTYTAKKLAEYLVLGRDNLIRVDMSEYGEKFNVSKLIGAPAGYVGYGEGGQLTEQVRRNPYSVILLDEIEKAHPDIFNLFLQVLEDGQLTDAKGKKVNFRNTIIIMTTNVGLKKKNAKSAIGFGDTKTEDNFRDALREFMRPEFLNRIDKVVVFNSLGKNDLKKIIKLELDTVADKLRKRGLKLKVESNVISNMLKKIKENELSARKMRELIRDEIENKLADKIIEGDLKKTVLVKLNAKKSVIIK